MAGVNPQLLTGGGHLLAVNVLTEGAEKLHLLPQQGKVVGNVPSHPAQAHSHMAGVGVRRNQGAEGSAADVHIHAPHHHAVAAGAENIAFPGDVALLGQVGNMHPHGGAGNPQSLRHLLLGDHGIGSNQLQNLSFPLGQRSHLSKEKLIK